MDNDLDAPFDRIAVRPLAGAIGAEIEGVDLAAGVDEPTTREIRRALLRHLVVFFHDQPMTREEHLALGRRFGRLSTDLFVAGPDGFPELMRIVKQPAEQRNFGGQWHTDVSFLETPALGSILRAVEVPEVGGDTQFSSMYLAFETLSAGLQHTLSGLRAVHCAHPAYNREAMDAANAAGTGIRYTTQDPRGESAVHPVVRTHPETGRRALYVNSSYTRRFEGWSEEESRPLLEFLYAHLGRPGFTCRFRWRRDSVAFWDNRCSQHFPVNDYPGQRRVMERVTIDGDRPF